MIDRARDTAGMVAAPLPFGKSVLGHWPVACLLLAFLLVGAIYSVINPIFEAPDEIQHFYYVKHLADGRGLPVQGDEAGRGTWEQEGSQPPLYYMLGAAIIAGVDTSDAPHVIRLNPQANMGVPQYPGNKNRIIHTDAERFPFRGTTLAMHLLRAFSLVCGCGTVLFTYLIGLEVLPRPALAFLSAALVAFIPQFLFISAAVSNDNLVVFLCSSALWLMLRLVRAERPWHWGIFSGLVIGLATLTKLSGLALLPLAMGVLGIRWRRTRSWPEIARLGTLIAVMWVVVAGWWYVRNWSLYGDPLGLTAMLEVAGRRPDFPSLGEVWGEFRGLRYSFWGLFGWFNILAPQWVYFVLDALSIVAGIGVLIGFVRWRRSTETRAFWPMAVLLSWSALLVVSLIRWSTHTMGSQGRLLFPAISAFMILFAFGLAQWLSRRAQIGGVSLVVAFLVTLAVASPFLIIAPAYARPVTLSSVGQIPADARVPSIMFGETIRVVGCRLQPADVRPADSVELTLYWQCVKPMDEDYNLAIKLFGRRGELIGSVDSYPGWGRYPTSLWREGEIIRDWYTVPISPTAQTPSRAIVEVGFYRLGDMFRLPARNEAGDIVQGIVGSFRLLSPHSPSPSIIQVPTRFSLDGQVLLVGYTPHVREVRAGSEIELLLFWRALALLQEDYTVFVHVIDNSDRIWAQDDHQPLDGDYPTSFWRVGETVLDTHWLILPADMPAGEYWVAVGMYMLDNGQRMPVVDDAGRVLDYRILLMPLHVLATMDAD